MSARGGELCDDVGGLSAHLLDYTTTYRGQIKLAAAQDDDALVPIRPRGKSENGLEGVAADYEGVDPGDEFVVAVRLAAVGGQKIE